MTQMKEFHYKKISPLLKDNKKAGLRLRLRLRLRNRIHTSIKTSIKNKKEILINQLVA
jgi:hypothetical protein